MTQFRKSSTVKLPGFSFGFGPVFSGDKETGVRLYAAVLGEDITGLTLDEARGRVSQASQNLFETALHYAGLYRALRGGYDFWDVVRSNAALHYDLSSDDVKLIVTTMVNARIAYGGADAPTPLNMLVDQFITLQTETAALGPVHTFSVAVHPEAVAQQAISGLEVNLRNININVPWPPAYFDSKDMVIFANKDVMAVLGGVDANNKTPRQQYAIAESRNLPALLHIQLCHLALTQFGPTKNWALFLSPVGFLDDTHRRKWYTVAGQQTKRNKIFTIGLFATWVLQSSDVARAADLVRNDPAELWTDREMMRRYATVVIIRRMALLSIDKRVQIIWFDPWMHDNAIKNAFAHSQVGTTSYRAQVVEAMNDWARENHIIIDSRYYGGAVSRADGVAGDGVKQCFAYLENLVTGQDTGLALPEAWDHAGFERLGYMRSA